VQRPRRHLVKYHGVFAPAAGSRGVDGGGGAGDGGEVGSGRSGTQLVSPTPDQDLSSNRCERTKNPVGERGRCRVWGLFGLRSVIAGTSGRPPKALPEQLRIHLTPPPLRLKQCSVKKHFHSVAALAALALGTISLIILFTRDDDLRIERPEWLAAHRSPATNAQDPALLSTARTDASDSAAKEMAEAGQLASSLTETKQTVTFSARTLIDAGIAEDIANGMVSVVEGAESAYRHMVAQDIHNEMRYECELLLAIWPDLGNMIRGGQVKLDIAAFPPDKSSQSRVPLVTGYDPTSTRVDYLFNLERWSVQFFFTRDSNPNPELFAKIASPPGGAK
jgi:hypothetical protein